MIASSDKAYGTQTTLPYKEETSLQGRHPYDVSKSCADLLAQSYAHTYDIPLAITRCGNFYGGGDLNWNRLVPGTIRAALRREAPLIRSDGTLIRDYLYVEDGAAAYMALAEHLLKSREGKGHAFNFSNEEPIAVSALVSKILHIAGSDVLPTILAEANHEIAHQYLDSSKARSFLGWKPLFDLNRGLARTVDWYRDYLRD